MSGRVGSHRTHAVPSEQGSNHLNVGGDWVRSSGFSGLVKAEAAATNAAPQLFEQVPGTISSCVGPPFIDAVSGDIRIVSIDRRTVCRN